MKLTVKPSYIKKYREGFPLINEQSVERIPQMEEGTIVELVNEKGQFLCKGYYGIQNKGRGWVLTKNQHERIDQAFFMEKLKAAVNHRQKLFNDPETTAFRIFNGEGDGVGGVTIDYYDTYYCISWYSEGIYQFKQEIIRALEQCMPVKAIYEKKRFNHKGLYVEDDDFVCGEKPTFPIIVKENGINYPIYLNDGAMVGVFLDQREVRKKIRDQYADGKTILNTFSYTGAFSAAAALGGAVKTTSVDLANRSKAKTIEMFSVNGIDYEEQDIIVEDVFKYFKYAVRKNLSFDLVILDPPSFARSKKHTFSVAKDYVALLEEAISITNQGGIIVASSNASNVPMKKFKTFVSKAFATSNGKYKILEEYSLPIDFKTIPSFPEGDYLKVLFIKKD
ncbi:class I SAM-dependent rRNA methyltransferase [Cytobacillus sp. FSL W7-1323]|uniref:class I SAM-dependent rRNA methyltransferase n=1 Tax=unclassified Cytobacillus TaxID=2675268 RepID=UPI002AFE59D1|nr:class I SAM-dependent rRNA methyltransferase [Cytobacillus sp. OWB-43]MEA1854302.1 class I SAM-dependent rRNA methyltransferase [Cytobacillus sp. OWB-43]